MTASTFSKLNFEGFEENWGFITHGSEMKFGESTKKYCSPKPKVELSYSHCQSTSSSSPKETEKADCRAVVSG